MKLVLEVDNYQAERFAKEVKDHTRLRNYRRIARILAQNILDRYFSTEYFSADGKDYEHLFQV